MDTESKIRIGITGQAGFIGTHLFNYFGTKKDEVLRVSFEDIYFDNHVLLCEFVAKCDVIIHLAALNRHNDPQVIYQTNIKLVDKLIAAMEDTNSTPHVLFSSSTQEERDNMFGNSKREGRSRLSDWAKRNKAMFTGLVIPNVYGSFGHPYYNSVVATFCHQITHGENPVIEIDAELNLIYIQELINIIWSVVIEKKITDEFRVPYFAKRRVSEILELLTSYSNQYLKSGIIPKVNDSFEYNLFNTFMTYNAIEKFYPFKYVKHQDERGSFVEIMKTMRGGQVSFSTTKPGITRGNHYHTRKIERFAVIKGQALICLRKVGTNEIIEYRLDGKEPAFVDIPIWYTHSITNEGNDELITLFWINEFYNPDDPDTYFEDVFQVKNMKVSQV